jgi:hypothetical protein
MYHVYPLFYVHRYPVLVVLFSTWMSVSGGAVFPFWRKRKKHYVITSIRAFQARATRTIPSPSKRNGNPKLEKKSPKKV